LAEQDKYQFQWWAVSLVSAIPYGGKKKGADSGIDGFIYFKPDGKTAIVSIKGGDNVNVAMVRDLAHVVKREKAQMGIFITLAEPTKPMLVPATAQTTATDTNAPNTTNTRTYDRGFDYGWLGLIGLAGLLGLRRPAVRDDLRTGTNRT